MIYYAHSLRKYNTKVEGEEIQLIRDKFGFKMKIYNPNNIKLKMLGSEKQIMRKCLEIISSKINILVFSTYKGHIGRGVYEEVFEAGMLRIPIYIIENNAIQPFDFKRLIPIEKDWAVHYAKIV